MTKQDQASLERVIMVEKGRTKLTVKHNGEDLTFLYPAYGPDDYTTVGEQIERDGLLKPTMAETVSLVHAAFNSDDRYGKKIRKLMEENWLWGFTGVLYVPKKGAYIQDNPKMRNNVPFMNKKNLKWKIMWPGKKTVRFVPFGYKAGRMSNLELAKNDFIKALAGEEGARKLAEVAGKHKSQSYLWILDSINRPITSVSAVGSYWNLQSHWLDVDSDLHGDYLWGGCAFGVQKKTGKKD